MRNFLKSRMSLRAVLVLFVFLIMLASMVFIGVASAILYQLGLFSFLRGPNPVPPIVMLFLFSVIIGTGLAAVVGNRTLKPLHKMIDATHRVAEGDFTVRLDTDSVPEVEDLTQSFNKMVAELGSIETLRTDFISNFSHEFKTPIVSIRGFAKLLRDGDLTEEERREYLDIIVQEAERLANLSTNVLDLTRLENMGILSQKEYFFLDEQVRRTAALMEPRWREKGLDVSLAMDSVTIHSDEELLQQVWVNLLDNAIKFTGEGGQIDIALKRRGEEAMFTIRDNGCGMDEATLNHLYDKFYQGDKSHAGRGNGLGLAMVKRIVGLCGGAISVESALEVGTAFTVTLPIGTME